MSAPDRLDSVADSLEDIAKTLTSATLLDSSYRELAAERARRGTALVRENLALTQRLAELEEELHQARLVQQQQSADLAGEIERTRQALRTREVMADRLARRSAKLQKQKARVARAEARAKRLEKRLAVSRARSSKLQRRLKRRSTELRDLRNRRSVRTAMAMTRGLRWILPGR